MKKFLVLAVLVGIIAIVFLSGCMQTPEKPPVVEKDYKSIAKSEVESRYAWNLTQIKSQMYREGLNDELIDNETEKELASEEFSKERIIASASEYDLTQEEIAELQNLSPEEFEQFKENYIKPSVRETVKERMKAALDEITAGFNFSVIEVKSKEEIPDIDTYLNSFGIEPELIQKAKKKLEKGKYIVIVELNIEEKIIIPEICNDKGKIIDD